jgi:hypothetical protein
MAEQAGNRERGMNAGVFAFWLLIQLLALVVAAGRFPLSSRYPKNGEEYALNVMLVTQILASSLMCGKLARNFASAITAIATALPFAALASFLADATPAHAATPEAYVAIWILTLAMWMGMLRSGSAKILFASLVTLLAVLGPIFWYLRAEFVNESWDVQWSNFALMGPIMGAISLTIQDEPMLRAFYLPLAMLLIGGVALFLLRFHRANFSGIVPAS